jgi:hypothetical protein
MARGLAAMRNLVRVFADEYNPPDIPTPVFIPLAGSRWGKPAQFGSFDTSTTPNALQQEQLPMGAKLKDPDHPIKRRRSLSAGVTSSWKTLTFQSEINVTYPLSPGYGTGLFYRFELQSINRLEHTTMEFTETLPKKHTWQFGNGMRFWLYALNFETDRPGD